MASLVYFPEADKYAVRLYWVPFSGWQFQDLASERYEHSWSINDRYFYDCIKDTAEEVEELYKKQKAYKKKSDKYKKMKVIKRL